MVKIYRLSLASSMLRLSPLLGYFYITFDVIGLSSMKGWSTILVEKVESPKSGEKMLWSTQFSFYFFKILKLADEGT